MMTKLLFFLVVVVVCLMSSVAGLNLHLGNPGEPSALEHQSTPLWINIPVDAHAFDSFLAGSGLKADVYSDGKAYFQILAYNLDSLKVWIGNIWPISLLPADQQWLAVPGAGWVTKFNILVQGPQGPGYLITSIDFQNDAGGWIRSFGAFLQQGLSSHTCSYTESYSSTGTSLSFNFGCGAAGGFQGASNFVKGPGNGVSSNTFVNWAVSRNIKYVQPNGVHSTAQWANVALSGVSAGLDSWYPLTQPTQAWSTTILSTRIGIPDNSGPICPPYNGQQPFCFWASSYGLEDHVNKPLNDLTTSSATIVDGSLLAPDSTSTSTSSSSMSNNMIWLYGILVGFGAAVVTVGALFAIMRYRARVKQVIAVTTQHAQVQTP